MSLFWPLPQAYAALAGCRRAFGACALVLAACADRAPPVEKPVGPLALAATVDRAQATTGDVITYTVTVDRHPDAEVAVPDFGAGISGFRIEEIEQNARPYREGGVDRDRRDHVYKLRADLVGSYVLPALEVTWKQGEKSGQAQTPAIFVEVKTVLEEGAAAELRDLKPLVPVPRRFPYWALGVVGGALGVLVLSAVLWRRRRKPVHEAAPIPPHVVVLEELRALGGFDAFDDAEAVRAHYFAMSELVRRYIEHRFKLRATDRTTPELKQELKDSLVPPKVREELLDLCARADLVKFADARPSADETRTTLAQILDLVERTWPVQEAHVQPVEVLEEVA